MDGETAADENAAAAAERAMAAADEAYERFFGVGVGFDAMLAQPSIRHEERGSLAEGSRFGTLARRVFQPLLSVEDLR